MDPSPSCKVPSLKDEGCSSHVVRPPLVTTKVGENSPTMRGKDTVAHSTATSERKSLLDKIQDLLRDRLKAKDGLNLALRSSSRSRMPPMPLSSGDFIIPWKSKERVISSTQGGVG